MAKPKRNQDDLSSEFEVPQAHEPAMMSHPSGLTLPRPTLPDLQTPAPVQEEPQPDNLKDALAAVQAAQRAHDNAHARDKKELLARLKRAAAHCKRLQNLPPAPEPMDCARSAQSATRNRIRAQAQRLRAEIAMR